VAIQITIINFHPPRNPIVAAENGWANLDSLNFGCWDDDGVKKNPRLKFEPVPVDAIFLPQTFEGAF
jgi:hypothetical protein